MAVTVSDVMRRRTRLALSRQGGPDVAAEVAKIMSEALGWDEVQMRRQFEVYMDEWKKGQP
jgi:glycerol-3-phosphate dehydrogenase